MSILREEIVEALHKRVTHDSDDESLKKIVDALISALPSDKNEGEPGSFNVGYNWAVHDVKYTLESVKEES